MNNKYIIKVLINNYYENLMKTLNILTNIFFILFINNNVYNIIMYDIILL